MAESMKKSGLSAPSLPVIKAVMTESYCYLYKATEKLYKGRNVLVKEGASIGKLLKNNSELLVVWKDSFLDEYPDLKAYNTYLAGDPSDLSMSSGRASFTFKGKSAGASSNSMQVRQLYNCGATYALDRVLEDSPLLRAFNDMNRGIREKARLLSLAYFIAMSRTGSLSDYVDFASHTRLPLTEGMQPEEINTLLLSVTDLEISEFKAALLKHSEKQHDERGRFWLVDTPLPHNILRKAASGQMTELYRADFSRNLKSFLSLNKKRLTSDLRADPNLKREVEAQSNRFISLNNVTTGQICAFADYGSDRLDVSDLCRFLQQHCTLEDNTPIKDTTDNTEQLYVTAPDSRVPPRDMFKGGMSADGPGFDGAGAIRITPVSFSGDSTYENSARTLEIDTEKLIQSGVHKRSKPKRSELGFVYEAAEQVRQNVSFIPSVPKTYTKSETEKLMQEMRSESAQETSPKEPVKASTQHHMILSVCANDLIKRALQLMSMRTSFFLQLDNSTSRFGKLSGLLTSALLTNKTYDKETRCFRVSIQVQNSPVLKRLQKHMRPDLQSGTKGRVRCCVVLDVHALLRLKKEHEEYAHAVNMADAETGSSKNTPVKPALPLSKKQLDLINRAERAINTGASPLKLIKALQPLMKTTLPASVLRMALTDRALSAEDTDLAFSKLILQTEMLRRLDKEVLALEREATNPLALKLSGDLPHRRFRALCFMHALASSMRQIFEQHAHESNRLTHYALLNDCNLKNGDELLEKLNDLVAERREDGYAYPDNMQDMTTAAVLNCLNIAFRQFEGFSDTLYSNRVILLK